VLKMIEWRWGLQPMATRDANAKNFADALDFTTTRAAIAPTVRHATRINAWTADLDMCVTNQAT